MLNIFLENAPTKFVFLDIDTLCHIIATVDLAFKHLYFNLFIVNIILVDSKYYLTWSLWQPMGVVYNCPVSSPCSLYCLIPLQGHQSAVQRHSRRCLTTCTISHQVETNVILLLSVCSDWLSSIANYSMCKKPHDNHLENHDSHFATLGSKSKTYTLWLFYHFSQWNHVYWILQY